MSIFRLWERCSSFFDLICWLLEGLSIEQQQVYSVDTAGLLCSETTLMEEVCKYRGPSEEGRGRREQRERREWREERRGMEGSREGRERSEEGGEGGEEMRREGMRGERCCFPADGVPEWTVCARRVLSLSKW